MPWRTVCHIGRSLDYSSCSSEVVKHFSGDDVNQKHEDCGSVVEDLLPFMVQHEIEGA